MFSCFHYNKNKKKFAPKSPKAIKKVFGIVFKICRPIRRVYAKFTFRIYWINFVNWLKPILSHFCLFCH
ncbi:hypothetical protein CO101_03700 [Candidatus Berkelbacteria bacterium CG_4_9_14_3_um_filter_39_23]|uniref:Uncharacterized protein n=1 Tax=Candidatus Berkelbacteria bacterium CG_4_9_14_3_um_filter_39_23 TaxID=1974508 RepID=A0A2M8C3Y3_9BACT|nr:MAG: hypothetical protein CO101_03700 [Candidatus Berkelbacteria bacterium CG_4_9_14_3_um_filter_39_23]